MNGNGHELERIVMAVRNGADPGKELLNEASTRFDPSQPGPLIDVLRSTDPRLVEIGLRIFVSLGDRAMTVVDHVLPLVVQASKSERFEISLTLAEFAHKLSGPQIAQCLPLVEDETVGTRRYMCLLLSEVDVGVLAAAVMLLEDQSRQAAHLFALRLLQLQTSIETLVDLVASENWIEACYAGASLIKRDIDAAQVRAIETALGRSDLGRALLKQLPLRRPRH